MSYDISLMDPVTNRVAEVPGHLMIGGIYLADYHPETGTFTPALNTNAELNITYNYSHYYHETYKDLGIRAIYGITGLDSIPMLEKIAENIKKNILLMVNGSCQSVQRKYILIRLGNLIELKMYFAIMLIMSELKRSNMRLAKVKHLTTGIAQLLTH